jgi:hypothetical protein
MVIIYSYQTHFSAMKRFSSDYSEIRKKKFGLLHALVLRD